MTWFLADKIASRSEQPRTEIHEGVTLERRTLLCATMGSGLLLHPQDPVAGQAAPGAGRQASEDRFAALEFEDFLGRTLTLARAELAASPRNEDAYLHAAAALMSRLDRVPVPELSPWADLEGLSVGRHLREQPLSVMELHLAPNATIPLHNHNGYAGGLLGLGGEIRVRSFDPEGGVSPASPPDELVLREKSDGLLEPGRVLTLSTERDNFHWPQAGPEGGRALDVFTFFADPGPSAFFELAEEPRDPGRRLYEAHRV